MLQKNKDVETVETDVLIIGGGSAGCIAAIKAKDFDPELGVTIMEKANIRRSGTLVVGMDSLNVVVIPGVSTPEEYVQTLTEKCEGVIDQGLHHVLARESFSMLRELESWGIKFLKNERGQYEVKLLHERGRFLVPMQGENLKPLLAEKVKKRGVTLLQHTQATSLISDHKRVYGATGFNVRSGEFVCCKSKATVLATGGCARFEFPPSGYLFASFDFPANAGDGYSMAYKAGVELTGFEYIDAETYALKDTHVLLGKVWGLRGAEFVNARGDKITVEDENYPKYVKWVAKEIRDGNSPVLFRMNHLPEEDRKRIAGFIESAERALSKKKHFQARKIDVKEDPVEVSFSPAPLCGGHGMSGIVIDENAKTSLDGLYAAGDVASVPRQMLNGAFVFGAIAGKRAAEHALSVEEAEVDLDVAMRERRRVFSPLGRAEGIEPKVFEFKLRRMIRDYIVSPKNESKLKIALWWIDRMRRDDLKRLRAGDYHELGRALETECILDCAEIAARASLERKESRWGRCHHRTDFPFRDDKNWLKHVIVKRDAESGEMLVSNRPVKSKFLF